MHLVVYHIHLLKSQMGLCSFSLKHRTSSLRKVKLISAYWICDLPFSFFNDPQLTPVLVGTLLAVCYGCEQNRNVVQQELSMDMLLVLLKYSKHQMGIIKGDKTNQTFTYSYPPIAIIHAIANLWIAFRICP